MTTDWGTTTYQNRHQCYKGERSVITVSGISGSSLTLDDIRAGAVLLRHTSKFTPVSSEVVIDVSDIIRTGTTGTSRTYNKFTLTDSAGSLDVFFLANGGQNPAKMLMPANTLSVAMAASHVGGMPTMIAPLSGSRVVCEVIGASSLAAKPADVDFDGVSMKIPEDVEKVRLEDDGEVMQEQIMRAQQCGTRYAEVIWESRSGNEKMHVFELYGQTQEVAEDIEIVPTPVDGLHTFAQKRSEGVSCVLRLRDVTAYDIWYYSDMLTSNNVSVTIDGVTYTARVETKSADVPEGSAEQRNIEIEVKLTEYATY